MTDYFSSIYGAKPNWPQPNLKPKTEDKAKDKSAKSKELPASLVSAQDKFNPYSGIGLNPFGLEVANAYKTEVPKPISETDITKRNKMGLVKIDYAREEVEIKKQFQALAANLKNAQATVKEKAQALRTMFADRKQEVLFILLYLEKTDKALFNKILIELKKELSIDDDIWLESKRFNTNINQNGQIIDKESNQEISIGRQVKEQSVNYSIMENAVQGIFRQVDEMQDSLNILEILSTKKTKPRAKNNSEPFANEQTGVLQESKIKTAANNKTERGYLDAVYQEIEKRAKDSFSSIDKQKAGFHKKEILKIADQLLTALRDEEKKIQLAFKSSKIDAQQLELGKNMLYKTQEFIKEQYRQIFPN